MSKTNTHPPIGSKIRCLKAPSFAIPETAMKMIGQIGVVISNHPGDWECEPAIGIQYPLTPYSDNKIAQNLCDEGVTWERVR